MTLRPSRAIVRSLEHLKSLVDRVLRDARVASGVDLVREHTTLKALVDDTELMVGPDADAYGVGLRTVIDQDGELLVDVRLVRSALGNLVRNALKYSHRGGVVELRARVTGELVHIEIEDACGGVDPVKLEQAFTAFVRIDQEKTGFGLGLAIAKQAIDAHAGTLRVQNVPGKGCIFVMELPVAEADAATRVGT
jgi:signal transduction histidine kinase